MHQLPTPEIWFVHPLQLRAHERACGRLSEIAGVELVVIDDHTRLREFRNELRQNDLYYAVAQGLRN